MVEIFIGFGIGWIIFGIVMFSLLYIQKPKFKEGDFVVPIEDLTNDKIGIIILEVKSGYYLYSNVLDDKISKFKHREFYEIIDKEYKKY